jgi:hypothetical protein
MFVGWLYPGGTTRPGKHTKNIKKHQKNYGKSTFLMGKATISTGPSIQ